MAESLDPADYDWFTPVDLQRVIKAVHNVEDWRRVVLVGGQALTAWVTYYQIELPPLEGPYLTADADFLGTKVLESRCVNLERLSEKRHGNGITQAQVACLIAGSPQERDRRSSIDQWHAYVKRALAELNHRLMQERITELSVRLASQSATAAQAMEPSSSDGLAREPEIARAGQGG